MSELAAILDDVTPPVGHSAGWAETIASVGNVSDSSGMTGWRLLGYIPGLSGFSKRMENYGSQTSREIDAECQGAIKEVNEAEQAGDFNTLLNLMDKALANAGVKRDKRNEQRKEALDWHGRIPEEAKKALYEEIARHARIAIREKARRNSAIATESEVSKLGSLVKVTDKTVHIGTWVGGIIAAPATGGGSLTLAFAATEAYGTARGIQDAHSNTSAEINLPETDLDGNPITVKIDLGRADQTLASVAYKDLIGRHIDPKVQINRKVDFSKAGEWGHGFLWTGIEVGDYGEGAFNTGTNYLGVIRGGKIAKDASLWRRVSHHTFLSTPGRLFWEGALPAGATTLEVIGNESNARKDASDLAKRSFGRELFELAPGGNTLAQEQRSKTGGEGEANGVGNGGQPTGEGAGGKPEDWVSWLFNTITDAINSAATYLAGTGDDLVNAISHIFSTSGGQENVQNQRHTAADAPGKDNGSASLGGLQPQNFGALQRDDRSLTLPS